MGGMDTTELLPPAGVTTPAIRPPAAEPAAKPADPVPDEDGRADLPPNSSRPVTVHLVKGGFVNFEPSEDPGPLDIPPNSSDTILVNFVEGGFVNFEPGDPEDD